LREAIKKRIRLIRHETARLAFVRALADAWGVELRLPHHLETLRHGDLVALRDAGVDLQNHGWFHADHAALSPDESIQEIRRGRDWLERELGVRAPHFAVPFGDVLPGIDITPVCERWLTFSAQWSGGPIELKAFNRVPLRIAGAMSTSSRSDRRSLRNWLRGLAGETRPE
jgi:peptidoglycan/xylan/chitin deacetylase (PgdA/CDA1 family)